MSFAVIDTHALVVSNDSRRYPLAPLGGQQSAWSAERAVTAEAMISAMDDAGVERAILLQSSTSYGFDNTYLSDSVAAHKSRFAGFFSVDILAQNAADQVRHWHAQGLFGLRVFTHGSTMKKAWLALDDPQARPAWDCVADLGLCVSTNAANLVEVGAILNRYPDTPLILEHVTRPEIPEGPPYDGVRDLLALSKNPNLYIKITPRTFAAARRGKATLDTYLAMLTREFGAARLLWGSYYPPTPSGLKDIVADAKSVLAFLPEADQRWIFAETAKTLFRFDT